MTFRANLRWSDLEAPVALASVAELDRWLDRIDENCDPESPTIVDVEVHSHVASIGLGIELSFVHLVTESGLPPYCITVGNVNHDESIDFFLYGNHHSEISGRNLIPLQLAREVLREFVLTGVQSSRVEWEEV